MHSRFACAKGLSARQTSSAGVSHTVPRLRTPESFEAVIAKGSASAVRATANSPCVAAGYTSPETSCACSGNDISTSDRNAAITGRSSGSQARARETTERGAREGKVRIGRTSRRDAGGCEGAWRGHQGGGQPCRVSTSAFCIAQTSVPLVEGLDGMTKRSKCPHPPPCCQGPTAPM